MTLYAVFAGLCFGAWPLIMKASKIKPPIVAATVLVATSLAVFVPFLAGNQVPIQVTLVGLLIGIAAGVLNGLGSIALQRILVSKAIEVTTAIFIIVVTQVVVTAIGGWLFYNEPFTVKKIMVVAAAGVAVYCLTGK